MELADQMGKKQMSAQKSAGGETLKFSLPDV